MKCHQAASGHTVGVREEELLGSPTVFPGPFSPLCNPSHLNFSFSGACSPLPTSSLPGLQRAARGMGVSQAVGNGKPQQFSENSSPQEPGPVTRPGRRLLQLINSECGPTLGCGLRFPPQLPVGLPLPRSDRKLRGTSHSGSSVTRDKRRGPSQGRALRAAPRNGATPDRTLVNSSQTFPKPLPLLSERARGRNPPSRGWEGGCRHSGARTEAERPGGHTDTGRHTDPSLVTIRALDLRISAGKASGLYGPTPRLLTTGALGAFHLGQSV